MSPKKHAAIETLRKLGIHTTADLDAYIKAHPKTEKTGERYFASRYEMLCDLVGEWPAAQLLQELAIQQCTALK